MGESADPVGQFRQWWQDAVAAAEPLPAAMVLATVDPDGAPAARTVIMTGLDETGFQFGTDYRSPKARELDADPRAALVFGWYATGRQIRVTGTVARVSRQESAATFAATSRQHQLAAWVGPQSTMVPHRATLDRAIAELATRWPEDHPVPVPDFWGGYRLRPATFDFWRSGRDAVHDRVRYRRGPDRAWVCERLAP